MKNNKQHNKSRRRFLQTGLTLGALLPLAAGPFKSDARGIHFSETEKTTHPLKILVLGGTSFLGPQQIAYALQRGHTVSTFTRGKTEPTVQKNIFDEVEQLIGDRENNLSALRGRKWDVVIDNSGNKVKWVKDSLELLKDNADIYMYTSSTGVYYPYLGKDIKEGTVLVTKVPAGITQVQQYEYDYGVMKTRNELQVLDTFGSGRSILVRPTYMMGPGDQTDRFTYWPERIALGGEILVPGKPDDPVQYIDVRDVAEWMIRLAENRKAGTYNAVGPVSPTGMHAFIHGVHACFSSDASFVKITDYEFLTRHHVLDPVPWIMPVGDNLGSALVNNKWGLANNLKLRPLADSVRDMHQWWHTDAVPEAKRKKLMSGENSLAVREKAIIAEWKTKKKAG